MTFRKPSDSSTTSSAFHSAGERRWSDAATRGDRNTRIMWTDEETAMRLKLERWTNTSGALNGKRQHNVAVCQSLWLTLDSFPRVPSSANGTMAKKMKIKKAVRNPRTWALKSCTSILQRSNTKFRSSVFRLRWMPWQIKFLSTKPGSSCNKSRKGRGWKEAGSKKRIAFPVWVDLSGSSPWKKIKLFLSENTFSLCSHVALESDYITQQHRDQPHRGNSQLWPPSAKRKRQSMAISPK